MANIWSEVLYDDLAHQRRTRTFCDIWGTEEDFADEFATCPWPNAITSANLKTLYYLLYARYGNSHIASSDENQFKYKVFAIIFQYGPNWQKELALQDAFRNLSDADLIQGAKTIFNHAHNPGTAPTTETYEELPYIDDQSTTNYKKNKLDAYYLLQGLLKEDVSEAFLRKFEKLFIRFVSPDIPIVYVSEG